MRHLAVFLFSLLLSGAAAAQDFATLKTPGVVGLMRHALAPGTGDPDNFDLNDCSSQRTLSEVGRDQARRTGAALRAAGVRFDAVWTSQWCRSKNTAILLDMGPVIEVPALNSHFAGQGDREGQTRDMRERLAALPDGFSVLLVTHQVNIRALSGEFTQSGEIVAARRDAAGHLERIGSFLIDP